MIASDVLNRVNIILQDTSSVRWPDAEKLLFLASAQRAVVELRPNANVTVQKYDLVDGTRQTLASGDYKLLDVIRNVDYSTSAGGKVVRFVDRDALNQSDPDWHSSTATRAVRNWTTDERDPRTFYVYPRALAGKSSIECLVSRLPGSIAAVGTTLVLNDSYMNALENYVLFKCFSKDSEFANPQKAANHLHMFQTLMGAITTVEKTNSPEYNDKGANPDAAVKGGV